MNLEHWWSSIPMLSAILGATSTMKVAYAATGTLIAAQGGWAVALLGQVTGSTGGEAFTTLIPAGALTATSGALVWVVKQIAGGHLVHRDPATAEAKLTEAMAKLLAVTEQSMKREETLTDLLVGRKSGDR